MIWTLEARPTPPEPHVRGFFPSNHGGFGVRADGVAENLRWEEFACKAYTFGTGVWVRRLESHLFQRGGRGGRRGCRVQLIPKPEEVRQEPCGVCFSLDLHG